MSVLYMSGRKIDWNNPPLATDMVRWNRVSMYNQVVKGSLRTIAHLDRLNRLAIRKFDSKVVVIQPCYNTTVKASAGTHDYDAVLDLYIPGVGWWKQQAFFRANGFGCWYRHPPLFGNHIHGFTLPVPEGSYRGDDFKTRVGIYVPGQLIDYYNEAFGLANQHEPGSDKSWFPKDKDATVFNLHKYIATHRRLQNAS